VFIEAKDDGGGGHNWTTEAISRAKLQSNHHQQTNIQFFTGQMPFLSPNHHSVLNANHSYPCPQPLSIFIGLPLCLAPSTSEVTMFLPNHRRHHLFKLVHIIAIY